MTNQVLSGHATEAIPNDKRGFVASKIPCQREGGSWAGGCQSLGPEAVSAAVSRDLLEARDEHGVALSREQVADRMSVLCGIRRVTIATLNLWASPAKGNQIPLHLADEFKRATNSRYLWDLLKAALADEEELRNERIGKLYREKVAKERELAGECA